MRRATQAMLVAIAVLVLAGCGSTDTTTSAASSQGPHLGDRCRAKTTIGSLVEVQTVKGPLTCAKAQSILAAYYNSAAHTGLGSGAALHIAGWDCISEPPPKAPLAGHCTNKVAGREFQMYVVRTPYRSASTSVKTSRESASASRIRQKMCEGVVTSNGGATGRLSAEGVSCNLARSVALGWLSHHCTVGVGAICSVESLGTVFNCRGLPPEGNETRCSAGDKVVEFSHD